MSGYVDLLGRMMTAIVSGDNTSAISLYLDKPGFSAQEQLSVYIRNYRMRLHKYFRQCYPALQYYIGEDEFLLLANSFIDASPSNHFNLDIYAVAFGQYVAYNHAAIFAQELAVLEYTIREIYHKPETPALELAWLEQQTPESLAQTSLHLRIASEMLVFSYPVSAYLSEILEGHKPLKPEAEDTCLLVVRDRGHVQQLQLEEAERALLSLIVEGNTLAEALISNDFNPYAADEHLAEKFQQWFLRWVNEGVFQTP